MRNRREFFQGLAGGAAGVLIGGGAFTDAAAQTAQSGAPVARREVRVGTRRVKVVDVHAHANFAEVADVIKDGPLARFARAGGALPSVLGIQELACGVLQNEQFV